MKDLLLGSDGDLALGAADFVLSDSDTAKAQACRLCLGVVEGENPFNPEFGVPWFSMVDTDDTTIRQVVLAALESSPMVEQVTGLEVATDKTTRVCSISFLADGIEVTV